MGTPLKDSKLLLGVTGSIAAYKAAEIVRLLKKAGADVQVIMSADASRFVPPLTMSTLSGKEALVEIFPEKTEDTWTRHIELGIWANLYVIAPATAQSLAKLAHGFCDNMLTAVALASRCPILICPAMDHDMYIHPATQKNLKTLQDLGYIIMPPEHGELASGLIGVGRLPDPGAIIEKIAAVLASIYSPGAKPRENFTPETQPGLAGKQILITAGPTQEAIDPVRFLSNHSTGTMGFALAEEAQQRGGQVTLISGPTHLPTPPGVHRVDVVTAGEMAAAVTRYAHADLVIMAAAVADYTPAHTSSNKLKKTDGDLSLVLKRTKDILAELGEKKKAGQTLVGFALETDNLRDNALLKLKKKNLDWIVLNSPNEQGSGFGTTTNKVTLFSAEGKEYPLPLMSKKQVARAILDQIEA